LSNSQERRSNFRLYGEPSKWNGWQKFFLQGVREVYPKGAPILEQGEHTDRLYYVVNGIVEYTHINGNGVETLVDAVGFGNVVGLQPFFKNTPALCSFVAFTDVVTASLDREQVYACIDGDSLLAIEIIDELCRVIECLVGHNVTKNTTSAKARAIDFICALCETDMCEKLESGQIFIGLSQDEFARVTKATRVTIAKALRELRAENLIETAYGGIIIKDCDGLRKCMDTKKS